jgi:hypothetical protein
MGNKELIILSLLTVIFTQGLRSQTIENPNYALKSHETLEINSVDILPGMTILYLSIENRIDGGNFCADKNIFLIDPAGEKLKLQRSSGIPVCPDIYRFKSIGEKLQFTLTFPALKPGTEWVDVIEECTSNCFWFYGVTLDIDLNKRLDEAFSLASAGKAASNTDLFRNILEDIDNLNLGIEGLLFINIINAAIEDGDKVNAMVWYKRLASSHAPRVNQYLKYLNDRGIKY